MNKNIADRSVAVCAPASWAWSRVVLALAGLGLLGLLGGCASQGPGYAEGSSERRFDNPDAIPDAVPRVEPRSKYGNMESYVVRGRRYHVKQSSNGHVERGLASWYGNPFHGRKTSSGERYDMYAMTAAHKTLPLPTYARVTNMDNGRSAVVKINDRGPFHGPRVIDLSYAAATKLGVVQHGTAFVEVRAIDPAHPTSDPGPFLAANAARSRRPVSAFDDGQMPSRTPESPTPRPANRLEPAQMSREPVIAAREPTATRKPTVSADPAAEARAQSAARQRAFEAALAALDAKVEQAPMPVAVQPTPAPKVARADTLERLEVAPERKPAAPKVAAAETRGARTSPSPAREAKEAPKVAAAAKKPGDDKPAAAGKQKELAKASAAKNDKVKVAAADKQGAAKVAVASKQGASRTATADQGLYLQVGAFGDRGNAERLRKKLSPHLAGQVRVQSPNGSGATLYKVRIGPFGSEGEARKVSAKLASLGLEQPRRVVN